MGCCCRCGDDIIWLVGERVDNRFRIDEKTRKVLVVSTIDQ
jgi:tRNA(Ile)-lysidine synthase